MNVMFERGSARDPSAQSSLCWDERCFCVKNRRASCMECCPLENDFIATIARVVPSRTKRLLGVIGRVKCAAVVSCRRLVLDTILRDLLHCLWRVGLVATSPMRWEACLLWMSRDHVSPVWGHSMCSQIVGKLGHCNRFKPRMQGCAPSSRATMESAQCEHILSRSDCKHHFFTATWNWQLMVQSFFCLEVAAAEITLNEMMQWFFS